MDYNGIAELFLFVAIFLSVYYLRAPLRIYTTQRQMAEPNVVRSDPNERALPSTIREHFANTEAELRSCGFEPIDDLVLPSQVANVAAHLRLFLNREDQTTASCTAIYVKTQQGWRARLKYVSFSTYFRSGIAYSTSNAAEVGVFPPRLQYKTNKLPTVQSPVRLYQIHCHILREEYRDALKRVPLIEDFGNDAVAYLRWTMKQELQGAASGGYLYLDESAGKYCPTLIGACLMTWKQLWPWKAMRIQNRDRNAARILADIPLPVA